MYDFDYIKTFFLVVKMTIVYCIIVIVISSLIRVAFSLVLQAKKASYMASLYTMYQRVKHNGVTVNESRENPTKILNSIRRLIVYNVVRTSTTYPVVTIGSTSTKTPTNLRE